MHPYMQTYINSNNREIIKIIIYKITVPLLRTLRFPEIRTCEKIYGLGWVIRCRGNKRLEKNTQHRASVLLPTKIIAVILSRRIRWAGNVARMGCRRNT
jgi:hypothetical protein